MSNSSLATYRDTSTGNWNYRNQPITRITIHHAAGVCNMSSFSSILRSGRSVSWNYAIGNDGTIGLFVDESHRAWTSSSPDNDHRAITIEVSNSSTGGNWPVSPSAYNALLKLCEDICRRNNIKKLTYTGQLQGSNLTLHQWFSNTACPGPYLKSKIPEIAKTVNQRLGSPNSLNASTMNDTSYSAATTGMLISKESINYKYLDPYIITLNRNTGSIDYAAMKNAGVVGVLIEAGSLYDSVHNEQYYRNPKLDAQVKSALSNKMPYGLYCDVKARSVEEANKELYQLAFCIRKYPPVLGMWLHLQLVKSKTINNKIVDTYYKELVRLGLKGRVGFYVTEPELNTIDWKKYSDNWYLWLNRHVSAIGEIDQLLTPQMFVVKGGT